MVAADRRPGTFLTKASFHNAIVALAAIGGSTNAVVHLLAIAGPAGRRSDARRLRPHRLPRARCWSDLQPAGRFLMEDFHRAGRPARRAARGARPARPRRADRHRQAAGRTTSTTPPIWDGEVIRTRAEPLVAAGGIAVLRGNLAPDGALIKPAAASPGLLRHRGRAVVFDCIEDFHARIDDPELDVDADSVLVLRGCGPKGYPGMPEVSNMPLPEEAARTRVSATWSGSATAG